MITHNLQTSPSQIDPSVDQALHSDAEAIQRVMLQLSWAAHRRLAHELEDFHLTLPQFMALLAVRQAGPAGCTMTELAEAVQEVLPTMTGIINRLVERRLIERRRDSNDRRSFRVTLTEAGHNLIDKVEQQNRSRLVGAIRNMSPHERQEMLRTMQFYLESTLTEIEAEPIPEGKRSNA